MAITLSVNGTTRDLDVDPRMPLLWALRDKLGVLGPKYGCGVAMCGVCTVHVDGQPVRACVTPVGEVNGPVTTIEGIGSDPIGQRLQSAWIELDVAQCGYCQAGQLMSATALLKEIASPTDEDIDQAMVGNLCRCATYLRIRAAIKRAAGLPEA